MSLTDCMFCRKCGYTLVAAASNTCPECGRRFDPADPRTYASRRWARIVTRRRLVTLAALVAAYLGSYAVWSRWAMRQAVEWDAAGYYFFPPENTARWETLNFTVVRIYSPLIAIDRWLGADMGPGYAPLWSVSAGQPAATTATPPPDAGPEASDR